MSQKVILFADNDSDFLQTRAEFLEREGYKIIAANSPDKAESFLSQARIHLAILDVRLIDDDNDKDISGEILAQREEFRLVPKIILTGYPNPYRSRDALRAHDLGFHPVIDYIFKEEGYQALISAVHDAFTHHVRINWELKIEWKARDSWSLVKLIQPDFEGERLLNHAEEFEDLLRRLFYDWLHIRVDRLLWQRDGRVAVVVFSFKAGRRSEPFVVVFGQNKIINEEAQRFNLFAPKAPGETGTLLSEKMKAETMHFAANAYTLVENDLETVHTFADLYNLGAEKVFNATVHCLYQETLRAWHQDKAVDTQARLDTSYRERLQLTDDLNQQFFDERIRVIEALVPALETKIEQADHTFSVHFKNQSIDYSNPSLFLSKIAEITAPSVLITVPGVLSGENILTDAVRHAWLTDFAGAGLAPLLWNYVVLEATIRFDWVEVKDLQRRHELEACLIFGDFARPDIRDLEPIVRKPARAIEAIRKHAAREMGKDRTSYLLGIFFQAARRLADFNPSYPLTAIELARLAQVTFSMAMIAKKIEDNQSVTTPPATKQTPELRIFDEIAKTVLVVDRKVSLPSQPFALLLYLFHNANRVCTKEELVQNVLNNEYKEDYLHTLAGRIRKSIEDDPERPRYLITEPGVGYRLIPKPKPK